MAERAQARVPIGVGNRRLLKLARLLRSLPAERFDYRDWVGLEWGGDARLSCGTRACALGWATTIPSLRRAGLRLDRAQRWPYLTSRRHAKACGRGDAAGLDAAQILFNLTGDQAEFLFVPGIGDSPRPDASAVEVAAHIERFVRRRRR